MTGAARSRAGRALATMLAIAAMTLAFDRAWAEPAPDPEDSLAVTPADPPEDTTDGADTVTEHGDSVAEGDVEVGLGADGSGDRIAHPRRRVRFRDGGLRGDLLGRW